MKYIIAYDIQNDKKRRKVAKLLEEYGVRLQFSLFECNLNTKELKEIRTKIEATVNLISDSVIFFNLCEKCNRKTITIGATYIERLISIADI